MVKSPVKNDSDTPWKDLLEKFFEPFLAFFFPHIHKDIQWKIPPEFLDKEFQKIVRDAALGRRFADKLVKVHRKNGDETWIYIHVEVQGKEEKVFSERMMVYHYRIFDTYRKPVVSLAVLADGNKEWRPREYVNSLWNCSFSLEFPVVKLLDFDESALLPRIKSNPFALVVLAHQKARISAVNDEIRYDFKWDWLISKGFDRGSAIHPSSQVSRGAKVGKGVAIMAQTGINADAELRQLLELRAKETHDRATAMAEARERGIEEGIQKGIERGIEKGIEKGVRSHYILRKSLAV